MTKLLSVDLLKTTQISKYIYSYIIEPTFIIDYLPLNTHLYFICELSIENNSCCCRIVVYIFQSHIYMQFFLKARDVARQPRGVLYRVYRAKLLIQVSARNESCTIFDQYFANRQLNCLRLKFKCFV